MKKSAFTILELSVVLVIIAVLVVGVVGGSALIKSSRLANARSLTAGSQIAEISGLIAWYETSLRESFVQAQALNNAQITSWIDISPNSIENQRNILTKAANNGAIYTEEGINNLPAVSFNGTSKFEIANLFQGSTNQVTVFLVLMPQFNPSATQIIPFDSALGQDIFSLGIKQTAVQLNAGNASDTSGALNPANFVNSGNYIICGYFNSVNSMVFLNDLNNVAGGSQISAGTNSLTGLSIGADRNSASAFVGLISEVILFNRPLKLNERRDVMSYLSQKYKINVNGL
jgi:prepilin-type N-terminal cleavage/methylation domain-containing protein